MKSTSVRLTDEEEEILLQIADRLKCRSRYGATSGQPSWRVMLQHLAEGRLKISNPQDKTRNLFINFTKPPGWWRPDEQNAMDAAFVAAAYKTTLDVLVEKGFVLVGDRIFPGNWKAWNGKAGATAAKSVKLSESMIAPSMVVPPGWFVASEEMPGSMLATDAETASGHTFGALEKSGLVVFVAGNGKAYVTGPRDSQWNARRMHEEPAIIPPVEDTSPSVERVDSPGMTQEEAIALAATFE